MREQDSPAKNNKIYDQYYERDRYEVFDTIKEGFKSANRLNSYYPNQSNSGSQTYIKNPQGYQHNKNEDLIIQRLMQLEGQCKIKYYEYIQLNKLKAFFALLAIIITFFGLFALKYSAWFRKKAFFTVVNNIEQATHIYIRDNDKKQDIVKFMSQNQEIIEFEFRKLKYYIQKKKNISKPTPIGYVFQEEFIKCFGEQKITNGLTNEQVLERKNKFGLNQHLVEIPLFPSYLIDVLTQPFFLLQYFFCFVYILEGYSPFSITLLFFSFVTTTVNYIMLYISYTKIKEIAEKQMKIRVIRDGKQIKIQSKDLVPGDLFIPEADTEVPADCIVARGDIYVNEANLTGESIPIGKYKIQSIAEIKNSNIWIHEGSKILQTKTNNTFAVVINTGYTTHRGRIVRKILNRRVKDPDMLRSLLFFVLEVVIVGLITFFSTLFLMLVRDISKLFVFFKTIDFLASSAPPSLPIFFNLAYSLSLFRLRSKGISGTQPEKTVQGSQIKNFCFDKTGTLTQNEVHIKNVFKVIRQQKNVALQSIQSQMGSLSNRLIWQLFSTCHTTKIVKGEMLGDEIDKQMFNYVNATMRTTADPQIRLIVENNKQVQAQSNSLNIQSMQEGEDKQKTHNIKEMAQVKTKQLLHVLRINQFESQFQSMSVLVRDVESDRYYVFSKGAPQKLIQTCSNIRNQQDISIFNQMVRKLSLNGLRTIAFGYKALQSKQQIQFYRKADRSSYMKNINILGLTSFENRLKPDTRQTIQKLINSNIQTKMITGDNIYIAVETAKRAGMIQRNDKVVFLDGKSNYFGNQSRVNNSNNETNQSQLAKRIFIGRFIEDVQSKNQAIEKQIQIGEQTDYMNSQIVFAVDNSFLMMSPPPVLSPKIAVFARIPPENKALIIKRYKQQQSSTIKHNFTKLTHFLRTKVKKIGMCGDGANDLIALRQADLSIGIQATDASYGSSFTINNMIDIDYIIRESKCTQMNIINLYQYYGVIGMFVLCSSIILITDTSYFGLAQLMYMNFGLILFSTVLLSLSSPAEEQSLFVPQANMMSLHNHLLFWGNLLIPFFGVLAAWLYYSNTPYYVSNPQKTVSIQANGFNSKNQATTLIYIFVLLTTCFNCVIMYQSEPWRKKIFHNIPLILLIAVNLGLSFIFAFLNSEITTFEFEYFDKGQMGICLGIMIGSLLLNLAYNSILNSCKLQQKKIPKDGEDFGMDK